ncbi:MAG: hypothetical protein KAH32_05730 [Chlamydiia bacterium]|nr:hypothetical protein [Chlamydiia bacterium]
MIEYECGICGNSFDAVDASSYLSSITIRLLCPNCNSNLEDYDVKCETLQEYLDDSTERLTEAEDNNDILNSEKSALEVEIAELKDFIEGYITADEV